MAARRSRKGSTRPYRVTVRFSEAEHEKAAAAAAAAGMTLSGYVAAAAIEPAGGRRFTLAQRRALAAELFSLRRALAGAAANLNQLTRIAHARKRVPKGVPALVSELERLTGQLATLIGRLDPRLATAAAERRE